MSRSEDIYGEKWQKCAYDTGLKSVVGGTVGAIFSLLFFRRRPWPFTLGFGIGLGMGISNCQHEFRNPLHKAIESPTIESTQPSTGTKKEEVAKPEAKPST